MELADTARVEDFGIIEAMRRSMSEVVDFHNHIGISDDTSQTISQLLEGMQRFGIQRAVVTPINEADCDPQYTRLHEQIAEAIHSDRAERLIGFLRLKAGQLSSASRELERIREYGFKGIKLHPKSDRFTVLQAEFAVEAAGELGIPVLVHCDHNPNCTPLEWEQLAERNPETTIILAHSGRSLVEDAIAAASRRHNILLDTSINIFFNLNMAARQLSADKFLFASDSPYTDRLLDYLRVMRIWAGDELKKVMSSNAEKLLGR